VRERLCGGRLASAARAERPRHGQPGRLPLSRSEAPVPLASFETPVCLLCLVRSDRLLHWRQGWICSLFNYLALFFSSFCGDDSCGLGSSELLVSIAAVSGNPVVLRREINLRFCVRGAEFWASGKERGVVVFVSEYV